MKFLSDTPACFRKRLYTTYEAAVEAAKKIPVAMRIYQCPTCQAYHMTSRVLPKKERRLL